FMQSRRNDRQSRASSPLRAASVSGRRICSRLTGLAACWISIGKSPSVSRRNLSHKRTQGAQKEEGGGCDPESEVLLRDLCVPLWQFRDLVPGLPRWISIGRVRQFREEIRATKEH